MQIMNINKLVIQMNKIISKWESVDEYDEQEFNSRTIENKQNIDDLIRWLEYRIIGGDSAMRMEPEQEEHWGHLLRNIKMKQCFKELVVFYSDRKFEIRCIECNSKIKGTFVSKYEYTTEDLEISINEHCGCSKRRIRDIEYYIENSTGW